MPDQVATGLPNDNPESPNFVGIKEAAEILGVTEATVRTAIHKGRLPFRTAYGHKVVSREALAEYIARTQPDGQPKRGRPRSK